MDIFPRLWIIGNLLTVTVTCGNWERSYCAEKHHRLFAVVFTTTWNIAKVLQVQVSCENLLSDYVTSPETRLLPLIRGQ